MKKSTLLPFFIFTLCIFHIALPTVVRGQRTSLAQQVFETHKETFLRADIHPVLPSVLDTLNTPIFEVLLTPTLIDLIVDEPVVLKQHVPGIKEEFIILLTEDAALRTVLEDEQVQTLLLNPDAITELANLVPRPTTLLKVSGDYQRGVPNTPLTYPLLAQVLDQNGLPLAGFTVLFRVTAGDGSLSVEQATTNVDGIVESQLTLGTTLGANSVVVDVYGIEEPLSFTAIAANVRVHVGQPKRPPLYWIDTEGGMLYRLAGADVEHLAPSAQNVTSLAVDTADGKLYWTTQTSNRTGEIYSAALDGTNVQRIKAPKIAPLHIAIDTARQKLYWINSRGNIQHANLNGKKTQNVVTGLDAPQHLAVDAVGGKLYWTNQQDQYWRNAQASLWRADRNGQNKEALVSDLGALGGIAVADGKLYWTEQTGRESGKIRRAALDGTAIEDIVTLARSVPVSVAVDTVGRKLYWTNARGKIQRANLNGKRIQNVVSGLGAPASIGLGNAPGDAVSSAAPVKHAAAPVATGLHPNYPNPFNPETWIPYHLAEPADVTLHIYAIDGALIRTLALGYQPSGMYQSRHRAAHWDGRNEHGEAVASGVYFYTLKAGDFTATRKMLIRK
ncbi:MAG: T9SS type A sorting domain-containing protein [Candidatus Poribacteria bacterium]|nr:T9SS type A sorting domain-containing protein [Candidatus Poribacteria bacterium]